VTETCCPYRRKILVGILAVLPEEQCGVSDAEVADLIDFDMESPTGKPVIKFRFCPWCGKAMTSDSEVRITEVVPKTRQPITCEACGTDFLPPAAPRSAEVERTTAAWFRCPNCAHMNEVKYD